MSEVNFKHIIGGIEQPNISEININGVIVGGKASSILLEDILAFIYNINESDNNDINNDNNDNNDNNNHIDSAYSEPNLFKKLKECKLNDKEFNDLRLGKSNFNEDEYIEYLIKKYGIKSEFDKYKEKLLAEIEKHDKSILEKKINVNNYPYPNLRDILLRYKLNTNKLDESDNVNTITASNITNNIKYNKMLNKYISELEKYYNLHAKCMAHIIKQINHKK